MPSPLINVYHPHYEPKNKEGFERMLKVFDNAESKKELESLTVLYILDPSYDREDISVAHGRIERAKGWKTS